MKILGLETSCDETAAAVVKQGTQILSDVTASSAEIHQKYGGIVPEIAARGQVEYIIPTIETALKKAFNLQGLEKLESLKSNLDAIAVTVGPGLVGSLLVGVETAKVLACVWQKPLLPVNHIAGHIYSAWLNQGQVAPQFPALVITISGGHTELILMEKHGQFKRLGATRDDAAGEAFDKVARALGLPYPGGPQIEKLAQKGSPDAFSFPRPMLDQDNLDFSFSGLKTAVFREIQKYRPQPFIPAGAGSPPFSTSNLAASFQQAVVDVVVGKTIQAAQKYLVKSILLTGGVSANKPLRRKLQKAIKEEFGSQIKFFCPPIRLAMDNAACIATAAYFNFAKWKLDPRVPQGLARIFKLSPSPNLKV